MGGERGRKAENREGSKQHPQEKKPTPPLFTGNYNSKKNNFPHNSPNFFVIKKKKKKTGQNWQQWHVGLVGKARRMSLKKIAHCLVLLHTSLFLFLRCLFWVRKVSCGGGGEREREFLKCQKGEQGERQKKREQKAPNTFFYYYFYSCGGFNVEEPGGLPLLFIKKKGSDPQHVVNTMAKAICKKKKKNYDKGERTSNQ